MKTIQVFESFSSSQGHDVVFRTPRRKDLDDLSVLVDLVVDKETELQHLKECKCIDEVMTTGLLE